MKKILILLPAVVLAGCSKKTTTDTVASDSTPELVQVVKPIGSRPLSMVLKASAFKMSGDYSDNVAVTLNSDGTLAYYPAPSDISDNTRPVELVDGWWLNRQGLSANSVFTRFTFAEYAALSSTPSQDEIIAAIIPGAKVTQWQTLSCPASEAMNNLPQIKKELQK